MLHLAVYDGIGCPTLYPGQIDRQIPEAACQGDADRFRIGVKQNRRILQRHSFEDQQQNSSPGKDLNRKQSAFQVGFGRPFLERP